ncbi:hypothetical protein [Acinetobacter indicus]|uniref:hypothetical protein n=1 Tax=Acinetobacter indicus TaxID=756892 RepID=UPI001444953F|nr:hypothetical protein [Acinetobacter indicus]MCO8107618.1 hypothetical protein [Acinetobacter indicus]
MNASVEISPETSTTTEKEKYLKKQQETLASLKIGTPDLNGYPIKNIYARGDEYLIYDTTEESVHQTIKVLIYTEEDDDPQKICHAFNRVKNKFDKLKTVLYKSGDNPLHKQRAASAVVIILQEPNKEDEVNDLLEEITQDIKKEYEDKLWGRLAYLGGALSITLIGVISACLSYVFRNSAFFSNNEILLSIIYCSMFAGIGGFFSVSLKSQSIFIMEATNKFMYFLYGLERNTIAIIAGLACFVLLSSEIIFANVKDGNTGIFFLMSVCFFSGFSEKFIPNALTTIGNE